MRHWFPGSLGQPAETRTIYYQRFSCVFSGTEKDLRPQASEWAGLIADDYAFCNDLGAEARQLGLDGLIVPSARHSGANQPVFQRGALEDPRREGLVAMTYNPKTRSVVTSGLA